MATHPDVVRLEEAITLQAGYIVDNREAIDELRRSVEALTGSRGEQAMQRAVAAALKEFRDDPDTSAVLTSSFTGHLARRFYQWVGERVVVSVFLVCSTAILVWASVTGKFKS